MATPHAATAADATDFWDGDADALAEASALGAVPSSIGVLRSPEADERSSLSSRPAGLRSAAGDIDVQAAHRGRRLRPLAPLALAGILAVCLTVGALAILSGGGRELSASRSTGHFAEPQTVTITTPAQAVTAPTPTSGAVAKPTVRKRHRKSHHLRTGKAASRPSPPVTTPVVVSLTQTATDSTPPIPSAPPGGESGSGESAKRPAGSGAVLAGGLPGIKQTEQMP